MTLPNFLIIGVQKAGTTTLYNYLKQHPQIYMSPLKEPHFFSYGCDKNSTTKLSFISNWEAYQDLFQKVSDQTATGEASTSYLYHPRAAERICHCLPKAKLIAILRDPAEGTYSKFLMDYRWQFDVFNQCNPLEDFAQAIQQSPSIHVHGRYFKKLQRYLALFQKEQLKICLFEDLKTNPDNLLQDIFQFLGVDKKFHVDKSISVYNSGGIAKNKLVYTSLDKLRRSFNTTLQPFIPKGLHKQIYNFYIRLRKSNLVEPPPLPQEIRQQLIDMFREDILQLQDFTQRDLSKWLN